MSWIITEEVLKQVSRPIAAIAGGEIYFDTLPDSDIEGYLSRNTGNGQGPAYRIPTTTGITVWANRQDGSSRDVTVIRIGLSVGVPATKPIFELNGPIILTGEDSNGNTIPLSNHEVGHLVTLAVTIRSTIVVTTRE